MAALKKATSARAKPTAGHGGADTDRGTEVSVTIHIGHIEWIAHDHGRKKAAAGNKEVKAFLTWVLSQL